VSAAKRAAGRAAAALVADGMRIGLGSGTTMMHAIDAIGARVRDEGLRLTAVPTSEATAARARAAGIPLTELDAVPLDLAIDGADEIEVGTFRLLKGRGGALLREKIVAAHARRFVIVATEDKLVDGLGALTPLPVEADAFGLLATAAAVAALGGRPAPRPGRSDGGHVILDCPGFAPIRDPYTLERSLRAIPGVFASGLFLMPVERVLLGRDDGTVRELAA
jgi:ribose 5-phosphate isomerase A